MVIKWRNNFCVTWMQRFPAQMHSRFYQHQMRLSVNGISQERFQFDYLKDKISEAKLQLKDFPAQHLRHESPDFISLNGSLAPDQ
ncbi:hypothetical protein TNCT_701511 [Trichonephila clavata]|uniref:Uncharacterized protein n=1 Tax=Trichonephila clavata TaxID=2740835 RepID=A0A8X6GTK6_TRICU|nr:hypothetical protein TNCT_701511 [Trichonephila clavata]